MPCSYTEKAWLTATNLSADNSCSIGPVVSFVLANALLVEDGRQDGMR